jgi:hypothetical protein
MTFVIGGVIDTARRKNTISKFNIFCEYKAICKTRGSGTQRRLFDEKKISSLVPLKQIFCQATYYFLMLNNLL